MSSIPNKAMPHAKASEGDEQEGGGRGASIKKRAGKIADKARENPKTAAAAGVAVAGAIAAAAIPLVRAATAKKGGKAKKEGGSGGSKKKKS